MRIRALRWLRRAGDNTASTRIILGLAKGTGQSRHVDPNDADRDQTNQANEDSIHGIVRSFALDWVPVPVFLVFGSR